MALNALYVQKNENIYCLPFKTQSNQEEQIIMLMISNGKFWKWSFSKTLSALLKVITSKHDGDFYCLNCLHLFRTKNKLESKKSMWK